MRRYIGIFFTLRGPVFSWDSPIFAYLTSFYRINDARHLWSNLQKCEFSFWEKEYDCNKCQTTLNFFFSRFWVFFDAFSSFLNELMLRAICYSIKKFECNYCKKNFDFFFFSIFWFFLIFFAFDLYFKVKMYIFDGLLNFIT